MRRKNKGVNITFSLYLARRRPLLAPPRRQSLDPPPGHANRAPRIPLAADLCWRRPAGNPLSHRRATPTGHPDSRSPPAPVGAAPPAKPYPTVGPRQQGASNLTRRQPMLAPPRRQPLIPPSGHANRAPGIPLAAGPCWRRPAGKALIHRRATPTGRALLPKVPLFPAGLHLFPVGPLPAGGSAAPFKSKFSRDNRHKKRKISPLQQFQPKIKIVSIKKSRTFRDKY